jgi:predicted alpha/beta-hydrolase family hydrolase
MARKNRILIDDAPSTAPENAQKVQPAPESTPFAIPYSDTSIRCVRYGWSSKTPEMIFTHGAGGTLNAPAMINFATGFAASKSLLYFQGTMNLNSRTKMFNAVIENEGWGQVLGGRSMGARAAVMAAHERHDVKALVLVSYPLKNEKGNVRDQILLDLNQDIEVVFISGDRDEMCNLDQLAGVRREMKAKSWLVVVRDADHGMNMKPKKATAVIGRLAGEIASKWLDEHDATSTEAFISWDDEKCGGLQSSWGSGQRKSSGIAESGHRKTDASATKKKIDPKGTATKSSGKRKKSTKQNEENEVELSTNTTTTRETRSKKRKSN